MEKLPMCRLCLAENVRMYVVINKDLHALYERLTDNPFVTGDRRPMLACFICCTKLKQCCQLQRKCLEAEERLTQMMNEDYELNFSINQDHFGCFNELTISTMLHVSIESDDACQAECDPIKEELPAVCERLDDVIEPEEEHQSDELELENVYSSFSVAEDVPAKQSESDSEDNVPLMEIKKEVEEEQKTRSAVVKIQKLHIRVKNPEDVITENQKKNEESVTKVAQNKSYCTSKLIPKFVKPLSEAKPRVNISVIDNTLDTNYRNNIKKRNLTNYTRIRTGGASYKCDICQYSCKDKSNIIKHIRVHTGEKPYKCNECQRSFSQKGSLKLHIRHHTGEKPYKCEECQLCFSQKDSLIRHMRTHTGEKPYKCDICQRSFGRKGNLKSHMMQHTGEKPYKCEECQRSFSQNYLLKLHIRRHTGEKPYKCDVCQRSFSQKGNLKSHIMQHTGEKPYKCDVCQRSFSHKGHLKLHIKEHTGEKPYKCEECQRCFTQKDKLRRHIRTHTGEKPYKCEECQRSFNEKGNLKNHIRSHTGEKPFKCEECQLCFSHRGSLRWHIRTHTKPAHHRRRTQQKQ
ncbi:hypothetical protein PYW08_012398 [Mythimna loreyi]|uniref:Uncharacterized protein n=1 Tax=Mythimna loreyi TaxID=667449 RepID=A0ACC2Q0X2_9NEOP|nr:hypothetical protein PYW08_012398 [Mythimna loreyi]